MPSTYCVSLILNNFTLSHWLSTSCKKTVSSSVVVSPSLKEGGFQKENSWAGLITLCSYHSIITALDHNKVQRD